MTFITAIKDSYCYSCGNLNNNRDEHILFLRSRCNAIFQFQTLKIPPVLFDLSPEGC
jgi:hypothetical protein